MRSGGLYFQECLDMNMLWMIKQGNKIQLLKTRVYRVNAAGYLHPKYPASDQGRVKPTLLYSHVSGGLLVQLYLISELGIGSVLASDL